MYVAGKKIARTRDWTDNFLTQRRCSTNEHSKNCFAGKDSNHLDQSQKNK